jgi:putative membrane protein
VLAAAAVLASLAALLHVFIWWLESFAWTGRARAVFGTSRAEAEATKELAFNQGFYNLFLALITLAGVLALALDQRDVGVALTAAGTLSMLGAALVLVAGSRGRSGTALQQGALPALALGCLLIATTLA